jgi:hypothetical protein
LFTCQLSPHLMAVCFDLDLVLAGVNRQGGD